MNLKAKIIIAVITAMTILLMNFIVLINSVKAVNLEEISKIDLHYGGMCEELLKYKGTTVKTTYVEYYGNNDINYPAYCVNKELPGVTAELEYTVSINKKIEDVGLWRTVINGYPYKSLSELGVADIDEAFTATKQAIYCYLYENTPEDYEAIGEAGERTLNALRKIVQDAQNSTEIPNSPNAEIISQDKMWKDDEINSNYISKSYCIKSDSSYADYEIEIAGILPQGSKLTNINGEETNIFKNNESFKIMMPKDKLSEDGGFMLTAKTNLKTKPVLYGSSDNPELQNYALTAYMFEDINAFYKDTYKKIEIPEIPEEPEESEEPDKPHEPKKNNMKEPKIPQITTQPEQPKILPVTGM